MNTVRLKYSQHTEQCKQTYWKNVWGTDAFGSSNQGILKVTAENDEQRAILETAMFHEDNTGQFWTYKFEFPVLYNSEFARDKMVNDENMEGIAESLGFYVRLESCFLLCSFQGEWSSQSTDANCVSGVIMPESANKILLKSCPALVD